MGEGLPFCRPMRRGVVAAVGALALALGLGSCGGAAPTHSMPCPMVKVIPDASYLTKFAGDSEDLTDTMFSNRRLPFAVSVMLLKVSSGTCFRR